VSDRLDIIIEDTLVQDEKTKSKGYNVVNGEQKLDVGSLEILKGGRGNTSKKSTGRNRNKQNYSVTVE